MNNFLNQPVSWQNENVQQTLAVGLLLIVVSFIVWSSFALFSDSRQKALHMEKLLADYRRTIEMEPAIRVRLLSIKGATRGGTFLLSGENEALAGAELQENFKTIVQQASGSVERSQNLGSQLEDTFQKIIVRSQLMLSTNSLQKVLYALESGRPYIFIENLDVKDVSSQKSAKEDLLKVTIDFYGYWRLGEKQ